MADDVERALEAATRTMTNEAPFRLSAWEDGHFTPERVAAATIAAFLSDLAEQCAPSAEMIGEINMAYYDYKRLAAAVERAAREAGDE